MSRLVRSSAKPEGASQAEAGAEAPPRVEAEAREPAAEPAMELKSLSESSAALRAALEQKRAWESFKKWLSGTTESTGPG